MAENTQNQSTATPATVEAGPASEPAQTMPRRTRGAGQDHGKPNPGGFLRNLYRKSSAPRDDISMKTFAFALSLATAADSVVYGTRVTREVIKAAVHWTTVKRAKPAKAAHAKRVKKTKSKEPGKLDGKKSKDKPVNTGTAPAPAK